MVVRNVGKTFRNTPEMLVEAQQWEQQGGLAV